jgi:hypothetical protein
MSERGRRGAAVVNSRYRGDRLTAKARATFRELFPDEQAYREHMADLARRSAAARARRLQAVT